MEAARIHEPPLRGLYDFVRGHLAIVNGLVLAAGSLVAVLDFLAPRFKLLPLLVYSTTAAIVALMVVAAVAPLMVAKALSAVGLAFKGRDGSPLWRRPAWQATLAVLTLATAAGFASIARADQGGLIAGRWPEARQLQASILGIQGELAAIGGGVREANDKLDLLVADSREPQKDLAARGYRYDELGLAHAIRQADVRAVALFAQAGYRATGQSPLSVLLRGDPWEPGVAQALRPGMFQAEEACKQSVYFFEEFKPPALERVRAFSRLCDPAPMAAALASAIERDAAQTPPTEWHARQARARKDNLAMLGGRAS